MHYLYRSFLYSVLGFSEILRISVILKPHCCLLSHLWDTLGHFAPSLFTFWTLLLFLVMSMAKGYKWQSVGGVVDFFFFNVKQLNTLEQCGSGCVR